jgi:nicotinamide riboside transporter PnuC
MQYKILETIGTVCGIIGAFLVAMKMGEYGYPFFFVSSFCLMVSAIKLKQHNFIALQSVFFVANVIGLFNYM